MSAHRLSYRSGALRAEWLRVRTQRGLMWLLPVTAMLSVALGWLTAGALRDSLDSGDAAPTAGLVVVAGYGLVPFLAAVIGLLATTTEFGAGLARSLYTSVPQRWPVLAAKAGISASVAATFAAVSVAFSTVAAWWSGALDIALLRTQPVLAAAGGAVAVAALLAVFGVGIGGIVRRASLGLIVLGVVLLLAPMAAGAAGSWVPAVAGAGSFLPMAAANVMYDTSELSSGGLEAPVAAIVLAAWASVAWLLAAARLRSADL